MIWSFMRVSLLRTTKTIMVVFVVFGLNFNCNSQPISSKSHLKANKKQIFSSFVQRKGNNDPCFFHMAQNIIGTTWWCYTASQNTNLKVPNLKKIKGSGIRLPASSNAFISTVALSTRNLWLKPLGLWNTKLWNNRTPCGSYYVLTDDKK